jgi:hypothetical protein
MVLPAMPTGRANARPITGLASSGDAHHFVAPFANGLTACSGASAPHHEGKLLSCFSSTRRHRAGSLAKLPLHHHRVEPAAELEADIRVRPDHLKPTLGMHAD